MFKPKNVGMMGMLSAGNDGKSVLNKIKKYDLFEIQWINFIITAIQIFSYFEYLYVYDVRLQNLGKLSLSNPLYILLAGELIRWAVNLHILQMNILPMGLQSLNNNSNNNKGKDNSVVRQKIDYPSMVYEQFRKMCICFISIMGYSFICIIMGAAPGAFQQQFDETLSLATLLTILTVLPYLCCLTSTGTLQYIFCDNFELIKKHERYYLGFVRQNAMWTIIGAWVASVVIPLDWDRDWQKYPIPNVVGALIGYSLSNAFHFGTSCFQNAYRFFKKQVIK